MTYSQNRQYRRRRTIVVIVLLTVLFGGIVALYDLYQALLLDLYTKPIEVRIGGLASDSLADVEVKRLRLQEEFSVLDRVGEEALWRTESGLTRDIRISVPNDVLPALSHITVTIGDRQFTYGGDALRDEWDVKLRNDTTVLTTPETLRYQPSLPIPRVSEVRNVAFLNAIIRALLLVLIAAAPALIVTRYSSPAITTAFAYAFVFLAVLLILARYIALPLFASSSLFAATMAWWPALLLRGESLPPELIHEGSNSPTGRGTVAIFGRLVPVWVLMLGGVVALLTVAAIRIHVPHLLRDEFFSLNAARMILEKGEPVLPSGMVYDRAPIYHRLIAEAMSVFPDEILGARLVNLVFNLVTALSLFWFLRRRSWWLAVAVPLVWLTTARTLHITRQVRMYSMFTALYVLAAIAFYEAIAANHRRTSPMLIGKSRSLSVHLGWLALSGIAFLLSADTQLLTIMLPFGVAVWGAIEAVTRPRHRRKYLIIFALAGLFLWGVGWVRNGTPNLIEAYYVRTIPADPLVWELDPGTYFAFLYENVVLMPIVFTAPLVLLFFKRDRELAFAWAMLLGALLFLLPQYKQAVRYLAPLMPFAAVIVLIVLNHVLILLRRNGVRRGVVVGLAILVAGVHLHSYGAEVADIRSGFHPVFDHIRSDRSSYDLVVADWPAAFTLSAERLPPDYILLTENRARREQTNPDAPDRYTGLPYLVEGTEELRTVVGTNHTLLVIASDDLASSIGDWNQALPGFSHPRLFVNRPQK